MRDFLHDIHDKIPYEIYDLLSLLSSVIAIISAIVSVLKIIVAIINGQNININSALNYTIIIFAAAFILLLIRNAKYGRVLRSVKESMTHNMDSFLYSTKKIFFKNIGAHKIDHTGSRTDDRIKILTSQTREYVTDALNNLANIMTSVTGQDCSSCVKLITKYNDEEKITVDNGMVCTFCRSSNSDGERIKGDERDGDKEIPICENTDFKEIFDPKDLTRKDPYVFYQRNLLEYARNLKKVDREYKNTTQHWEKRYRSAIVVPIEANNSEIHFSQKNEGMQIIGFLCVDSLSTNAFREDEYNYDVNTDIMKSFAEMLYVIFNQYNFYLKKITEDSQKQEKNSNEKNK